MSSFVHPVLASVLDVTLWTVAAVAAAGLLCVAYGVFAERRWYRKTVYRLAVLPEGASGSIVLLHLSDLHFKVHEEGKVRFLASLGPSDVTVVTGDILGEPESVETAVRALRAVRGRTASYFVLGSNDYFAPKPLNYLAYFRKTRPRDRRGIRSRPEELVRQLEQDGWVHLKNLKATVSNDGMRMEVVGLDDPHIERHDLRVATRSQGSEEGTLGLALVHSPDPAPELAALGYQLILSGHTHGGQVRLPFVGALITNSSIPARLSMGMSRLGPAYLHVSPGLGTSKYAPFRFLCRPEATVIELTPRNHPVA